MVCDVVAWKEKRSLPQNSYLHKTFSWMKEQHLELGNIYTVDDIKLHMKEQFASKRDDNGLLVLERTRDMDVDRMRKFINDVEGWCIEWFHTPMPPNDQDI